ncbi:glucuronate isomerase [Algibacter mikhailovii]|uniref:glucuronate isomerase n=1 Tax=Algibacter mikhailovii TaxID=425498 RepID=UPI002494AEC1|nr:glucuronate isomerase [Algibacter mikhailovii]
MSAIKSDLFISDNFLLNSKEAEILYHNYAAAMPIIDYHNHLSPKQIAEDLPLENITDAWLDGDHYKWRAMRANGIDEAFITGDTAKKEKFKKWAETVPYTLRNPLFHWTHLELKRYFNIDDILQASSATEIYVKANNVLASKTPSQFLEQMNVEVICTTDDPIDSLKYHKAIADKKIFTKVFPTFRPDALLSIEKDTYSDYILKLGTCFGFSIDNADDLINAVQSRIDYFHDHGCRLSDYGLEQIYAYDFSKEEANTILQKRLKGLEISLEESNLFASFLLFEICKMYHAKGWVQQFHLGAIRNNNSRLLGQIGLDAGVDSIGDSSHAKGMSVLFNKLESEDQLAKTITYNLNPAQNEVFATMMGNFQNGDVPGKMQWGSGWWFLDQKDGMEKQLNTLSNMGLLTRFVGMLTDSRSLLSFPRHEYFRRILCNLIAEDLNNGLVPNDIDFLGKIIQDICYNNAVNYFKFN